MRFFRLKQFFLSIALAAGTFFFLATAETVQAAGLIPCATSGNDVPCTLCHFVIGGKGVIDYLMELMTWIGLAVIATMGVIYIISTGNEKLTTVAKKGIFAAAGGFALMLSGWLIVQTVMWSLSAKTDLGIGITDWNTFTCDTRSSVGSTMTHGEPGVDNSGGPLAGGTCETITAPGNPCSVENLRNTCFADVAEQMSQICNAESRGNPFAKSGTDHCPIGGPSVSGGLFQINTTVHGPGCAGVVANPPLRRVIKDGNGNWGDPNCRITNESARASCMQQTYTPDWNIQRACDIYRSQGLGAWGYSADKCNLR